MTETHQITSSLTEGHPPDYFTQVRTNIKPLLPSQIGRCLEIGCGQGKTLEWIHTMTGASVFGVELVESEACKARLVAEVVVGNIELIQLPFPERSFDVILTLDVLEHLQHPWTSVRKLHQFLRPGGCLIASIPNVRHIAVLAPLLIAGRWTYTDHGLLDRTHLRFFTKRSAIELMECSGLKVDKVKTFRGRKSTAFNIATLGLLRPFFDFQYLIRAVA
jgi:2-polyprenyl-3-methyl-5-hydroxy-6-metoxy-1,4-benzoquinol methylase